MPDGIAENIINQKYAHLLRSGRKETWKEIASRVVTNVLNGLPVPKQIQKRLIKAISDKKIIPAGRYLYAAGREHHQVNNCIVLRAEDSREGWASLLEKSSMSLMTGAGIGVNYSNIRAEGQRVKKTGGFASGPLSLMQIVNEVGRHVMMGGSRRSAILASLSWKHPDIMKFIRAKDWSKEIRDLKKKNFSFPAPMELTNLSVGIDEEFFKAYPSPMHKLNAQANSVYWEVIRRMLKTGEPGFLITRDKDKGEDLANACGEVRSADDSDICNLGSINLARVDTLEEMEELVELLTILLLGGSIYSDVPYNKIKEVRDKSRRIGVGLMGVHEWLISHGKPYDIDPELGEYLEVYTKSDYFAKKWASILGISTPLKTRAIAPTGSISILAGPTTSGIEPIFCAAYKRRYLKHNMWCYQYVIEPIVHRLVNSGISPEHIEDAYTLAKDTERRVRFQAWVQQFVDQAISSTINLPSWGSKENNEETIRSFGDMLYNYLPNLRGITTYPDGARPGQPFTPVSYEVAISKGNEVFQETNNICSITGGGQCGE